MTTPQNRPSVAQVYLCFSGSSRSVTIAPTPTNTRKDVCKSCTSSAHNVVQGGGELLSVFGSKDPTAPLLVCLFFFVFLKVVSFLDKCACVRTCVSFISVNIIAAAVTICEEICRASGVETVRCLSSVCNLAHRYFQCSQLHNYFVSEQTR